MIVTNPKMRLVQEVQLLLVVEGLRTFEELVVVLVVELVVELRELKERVDWSAELEELVELASALITVFALFTPVVYAPCTSPRYCASEPSPAKYNIW